MDYRHYQAHRAMLRDMPRTGAFGRAIAAVVKPGDVVLDVGAGIGILSLMAAQAGAARVYAVERTPVAAMAAHLAALNGTSDRIHVLQCDVREARLPEQVDVVVSEWMGTIGVDENMLGSVLWARDHYLKPGGILVPASVTAWLAPVFTHQRADVGFFTARPYGLDLSPLAEPELNELLMTRRPLSGLAAPAQALWRTDVATAESASVAAPYRASLQFRVEEPVRVSALAAWFSSELGGDVVLSNAPDAPDTHWGQLLLPLQGELAMAAGDTLSVELVALAMGPGPLQFAWTVCANDGAWQGHDTCGGALLQRLPQPPGASARSETAPQRSALSRFFADLSSDPDLLAAFLADSDQVMAEHQLSAELQAALKSRDPLRIHNALYEAAS